MLEFDSILLLFRFSSCNISQRLVLFCVTTATKVDKLSWCLSKQFEYLMMTDAKSVDTLSGRHDVTRQSLMACGQ